MNKSFFSTLNLFLYLALAFFLPWQTKLIIRPAASNYWEISLFPVMFISLALVIIYFTLNFKNVKKIIIPKILLLSFSLFIASMILTIIFAIDPILSIYRYFWFLIFATALLGFKYLKKDWQLYVLLTLLSSFLIQAGIGIYQFLSQTSYASTLLGMSFHDLSQAGVTVIETASGRFFKSLWPARSS